MTSNSFYPIAKPSITALEQRYVQEAIQSGWISSLGSFIDQFEREFATFCGTKHAIAVSNGTAAIHLALKALGIGKGDEVIVPDLSFIATANAVLLSGAKPVFADIDQENLCLAPADLVRCLSPRTKAIMPVHLYGHPAEMDAINAIAQAHGLYVIEDAAEAHGAHISGCSVGNMGDCAIFSLYGNKTLTTGEGGAITTNDDNMNERCRVLRDHAMSKDKRYWHNEAGYNYRLTNLQAAVGCAQLQRAPSLISARQKIHGWYSEAFSNVNGIRLNRVSPWATPSYWMICAEFDGLDEDGRDRLMQALHVRGVDTRPYFYPMSDMPYFDEAETPVAHALFAQGINLPTYVDLTQDDVRTIAGIVKEAWSLNDRL